MENLPITLAERLKDSEISDFLKRAAAAAPKQKAST